MSDGSGLAIPDSWRDAAGRIAASPGLAIVLGDCDTGKSALCSFLARDLCRTGLTVGLVDADVGQSTIGPHMTIGGKLCETPEAVGPDLHPPFLYFTGATTPERCLIDSIVGTAQVADRVRETGPNVILVDTTGMVEGEAARRLKTIKVQWLQPAWIVALQRGDELAPLLLPMERERRRVIRLPAPAEARRRSRERRRANRRAAYTAYLAQAEPITLEIAALSVYDCPENAPEVLAASAVTTAPAWPSDSLAGALAGLNDVNGHTLAVGRIVGVDCSKGTISLAAPAIDRERVTSLKIACAETDCGVE